MCRAFLSGDDLGYAEGLRRAVFTTLFEGALRTDPHMAELRITPARAPADFHPRYHNVMRRAKVPALLLNATSLNTGHSWQFTPTSMGESPFSIVPGADPLPRLRRANYHDQHGKRVRGVTLSQAVAASACVPGLFAPIALRELYKDHEVRLVDGGVYDNQGALGLLQEDCNVLIVSDACGQLGLTTAPGGGHLAPLMRSMSIFQERMRQSSYRNLRDAHDQGRLMGLAYVHLKQDLDEASVDWIHCEDPSEKGDQLPETATSCPLTGYGVLKERQKLLADIRTDLDVFSEIEAATLMASGYLAMRSELEALMKDVPALQATRETHDWWFTEMIARLGTQDPKLQEQLAAGAKPVLRLAKLDRSVRYAAYAAGGVVLGLLGIGLYLKRGVTISVGSISIAALLAAVKFGARRVLGDWAWVAQLLNPVREVESRGGKRLAAFAMSKAAQWVVPPLTSRYLEVGKLTRLDAGGTPDLIAVPGASGFTPHEGSST